MNIAWQSIECMTNNSIWVLKYDIYFYPEGHEREGNFCTKDEPSAQKFTDCHGWYRSEIDALKVLRHFRQPNSYRVEKVWGRELVNGL